MKTAVSIPDELFKEAEKIAKQRGVSRSELYAEALRKIVNEEVSRQLNEVYANLDSSLEPAWQAQASRMLKDSEW